MLNIDGAAKGNPGLAAGGGVFRGPRGEWLFGFAENLGYCTSARGEIKAILRGLKLARERGISKLWIQSNSLVTVGILKGNMVTNAEFSTLAEQRKNMIEARDWEVLIWHCYKEANKVADDALANLGVNLDINFRLFFSAQGDSECSVCGKCRSLLAPITVNF